MSFAPTSSFLSLSQNGDCLSSALSLPELASFRPLADPIAPTLSRWDRAQGIDLGMNQSDCNWFVFDAVSVEGARRFSGIVALHRTGPRLARLRPGLRATPIANAPTSIQPFLTSAVLRALPAHPVFDARPLFVTVLYDHERRRAESFELPVEGAFEDDTFSFVEHDGRRQLLQGAASTWRQVVPPILQAFFARDTPAFAIRSATPRFELELFLRPHKDPVVYGEHGSPALRGDRTTINYVQRSRLDVIGALRLRSGREWLPTMVLRGDATQDRHWMSVSRLGVRWMWLMARLDDGRELMAFEMRTATGGRNAPADAGRAIGGGAWVVETNGQVRPARRWSLTPEHHVRTPRGLVPNRFRAELPDEGIRLVLEHEIPKFVPTRALGELFEAGIWESSARLVDASGTSGGRFWVDVMPAYGGA